jgi:hypothetical protein
MLFSFFNGKQYDFSSFFTTFVLQKENNANQKSIVVKTINNNDETK